MRRCAVSTFGRARENKAAAAAALKKNKNDLPATTTAFLRLSRQAVQVQDRKTKPFETARTKLNNN